LTSSISYLGVQSRAAAASDPLWASVVLLVGNNNGSNGSTTFIDQSGSGKTITANGNAQWSTASAPSGMTSSGLYDGTGDYLASTTATVLNDMTSSTVTKTIEFFINPSVLVTGAQLYTSSTVLEKGNLYIGWQVLNNGSIRAYYFNTISAQRSVTSSAGAVSTGAWTHVAFDYDGAGNLTIYANGTSVGSGVFEGVSAASANTTESIGRNQQSAAAFWNGYIGPLRITNARRYTGAFTPPTLPFPTS
jgi:hypothetical protein